MLIVRSEAHHRLGKGAFKYLLNMILVITFLGLMFGTAKTAEAAVSLMPAIGETDVSTKSVYYVRTFSVDYLGGPIILAADAAGTQPYKVLDELWIYVYHEDGTNNATSDAFYYTQNPTSPRDISFAFEPGRNYVKVVVQNYWVFKQYSTGLWLTNVNSTAASLSNQ